MARPTSTRRCTRGWPRRRATRASPRSPTGLRPWPRPRSRTPGASTRRRGRSRAAAFHEFAGGAAAPAARLPRPVIRCTGGSVRGAPARRARSRPIRPATGLPMPRIESKPTDGLSYSPVEPKYWDPAGLVKEIDRVYDICVGCRLCFNLCGSFPAMFDAADAKEQDVRNLSAAEKDRVVDLCYDCKLCYLRCPYTPRDGHEFQLDFPRLMFRARAVRAKEKGLALRERLLGNPNLLGRL